MTVRAKFQCTSIIPYSNMSTVYLSAVYSTDPNDPNKAFTDATPSGQLSIVINNDKLALQTFQIGKSYYLDFTPV